MTTLAEKDPNVAAEYDVDFHDELVVPAPRSQWIADGGVVFYPHVDGWYFEVTTAGRTGRHYPPSIPRAAGEPLTDGSAVLTCVHPSDATVALVSSVTWTVPSGITLDSQRIERARAYVTLSGGTDGVDYEILCRMTPTTGSVVEKTISIPVRAQ